MKTYKLFTYLLPLMLVTAQASQMSDRDFNKNTNNLSPEEQDLELQKGIEKYLPQFFKNNQQMLEKLQEGKRQAVVVIGQTGAGKSTLIGALLGHKFETEKKEVVKDEDDMEMNFEDDMNSEDGMETNSEPKIVVNKTPGAPKIGHSTTTSETIFPQTYLDKEKELAFIDTAGLSDTRKDGESINICSAIGLRSLIEKVGSVQCIIGLISYNTFIEGRGSDAFLNLLNVTSNMLENTSLETFVSSMVLAFTKVPKNITKKDIGYALRDRYDELIKKKKEEQMTEKDQIVETMYKVLFPTCCRVKNKKNVPFFLISPDSLLKQGRVRKYMLPKLENATKVESKDIGLVLDPSLQQKTKDWLTKRSQSIANDIRNKENIEKNILSTKKSLSFDKTQLCKAQQLLNDLTNPNKKDKKEILKESLNETIENNTQRVQELELAIKKNKKGQENTEKEIVNLNNLKVEHYKKISSSYNQKTKQYEYSYKDVPIDHITYNNKIINLECGSYIGGNYKIVEVTKNYKEGLLKISLSASSGGWLVRRLNILWKKIKKVSPDDFNIFAQKKHIYQNCIKTLMTGIENLKKDSLKDQNNKERLEKEIKISRYQLRQLQSNNLTNDQLANNKFDNEKLKQAALDLLQEEQMIEQTKQRVENKKQVIKKIESDLQILQTLLPLLTDKIARDEIIADIITHVDSFIKFHDNCKEDIKKCKQYYMDTGKKKEGENDGQDNNNLVEDNKKHIDTQPGGELEQNDNNIDYMNELEERKEDDDYCDNNNNNNTSLSPSLILGTGLLASRLSKKKN